MKSVGPPSRTPGSNSSRIASHATPKAGSYPRLNDTRRKVRGVPGATRKPGDLRDPESMGRRVRENPDVARLRGAGDDERRLRLLGRARGLGPDSRGGPGKCEGHRRGDASAGVRGSAERVRTV